MSPTCLGREVLGAPPLLQGPPSPTARGLPSVLAFSNAAWQVLGLRGRRIRVWMERWFIFVAGDG